MKQKVQLKYINKNLQIGLVNWREAYLLQPKIIRSVVEVDRGRLVYREKGKNRRISYKSVKKGLIRTSLWIVQKVPDWLF